MEAVDRIGGDGLRKTLLWACLAGFLAACATAGSSAEDAGPATQDAEPRADGGLPLVTDASGAIDASENMRDSSGPDVDAPDAEMDASVEPPDAAAPPEGGSLGDASFDANVRDAAVDATPEDAALDAVADVTVDASQPDAAPDAQPWDATTDAEPEDAMPPGPDGSEAGPDADATTDAEPEPVSRCVPGVYRGTFEGELRVRILLLELNLFDIAGEIEITAEAAGADADRLQIQNGRIEGADQDGNPVQADVSGTLDCGTLQLEDGTLTNGLYVREAFDMEVEFEGTVEATYEPGETPRVVGTWSAQGERESGDGTFEAALEPPAP